MYHSTQREPGKERSGDASVLRPETHRLVRAYGAAGRLADEPGRFGFRGELALRFATKLADEARPPELTCDQAVAVALGDTLSTGGKYLLLCNNIDLSKKYQVAMKGAMFYVPPIDEAAVCNELLEVRRAAGEDIAPARRGSDGDAPACGGDVVLHFGLGGVLPPRASSAVVHAQVPGA